ncbi:MMPL family transporter [Pseudofulvimonas gallinarii]|uniref:MMPL family transporter n=1 Tax=Pseudofulvimonas gallinarii TaxID=634155 RepID=UPI0035EB40FB
MKARDAALAAIVALLLLGAWAASGLRLGSDLARFMPDARDADQRLLRGELGSGPASRILLLAIAAGDEARAAGLSRELAARLRTDPAFAQVLNGEIDESAMLATLMPLRFSHSPGMDVARFDVDGLYEVLLERLADLGGAGGEAFDTLLAHDPHFLTLALAESWQPLQEPTLRDGVWFTGNGEALLLVQTEAAGFDPQAQAAAIATIRSTFETLAGNDATLLLTGAGSFSARMSERVAAEAGLLGGIALVSLVAMLLLAYRSALFLLASAVPMACAAAAGVIALRLGFDEAHGITLAFAFTLIGVAQDYPVHLLSHLHPGVPPAVAARRLWPALRLGVASTAVAYASLFSRPGRRPGATGGFHHCRPPRRRPRQPLPAAAGAAYAATRCAARSRFPALGAAPGRHRRRPLATAAGAAAGRGGTDRGWTAQLVEQRPVQPDAAAAGMAARRHAPACGAGQSRRPPPAAAECGRSRGRAAPERVACAALRHAGRGGRAGRPQPAVALPAQSAGAVLAAVETADARGPARGPG